MNQLLRSSSSFRDPSGKVYYDTEGNVYRSVHRSAEKAFVFTQNAPFIKDLEEKGSLVRSQVEDKEKFSGLDGATAFLLSHPRLPYISYPYEWSFEQLRDAALFHLEIHKSALKENITLSDATAYNVQFTGSRPIFLDRLSFIPYQEGMFWEGQKQFVEQFLNPLLLWSSAGVAFHSWYKGCFTGIPSGELHKVMPFWKKYSFKYLNYIWLPQFFEKKQSPSKSVGKERRLPKAGFLFILNQLYDWIKKLPSPSHGSFWEDYKDFRSYSEASIKEKHSFLSEMVSKNPPKMLLDIGCNTGEFSEQALQRGAKFAVGIEMDHGALAKAYASSKASSLSFLPLYVDLCSPSSNMGWNEAERMGFLKRANFDFVLALAVVHHIVISGGVPLREVVRFLIALAPRGIIEWVPKKDPMMEKMLAHRKDIFEDYTLGFLKSYIGEWAHIVEQKTLSCSSPYEPRVLFFFERK